MAVGKVIRERMHIKDGDTLLFEERGGKVYIRKIKNFLEMEGSLPSLKITIKEAREKAMEEMAKESEDV